MTEKLLNYTTKIPASRTVGEIQAILAKHGANEILVQYEKGNPTGLLFSMSVAGSSLRYALPCRWEAIQKKLQHTARTSAQRTADHARNVGWRIIKDWVEAQCAVIDTNMVSIEEVFLPYQLLESNVTIFAHYNNRLLTTTESG